MSNPCFEVWLLDHMKACPPSYTLTPDVESAAAKAGIVGGNRNKYVNDDSSTANISMPPHATQPGTTQRRTVRGATGSRHITSRNTPLDRYAESD
ncbi:RloB family protein [Bifidobacterium longum]|uniref:RloB family protein n=1 Tax=Bifidobacterium longum TaxID=216816 RepID=UPI001F2E2BFE|nr:RloB family protein [Bifidobacterium longum]